ncbi:21746_t:CDS:1, partial [Rhizophagus irregularis]
GIEAQPGALVVSKVLVPTYNTQDMSGFPRADAADFRDIYSGYENKNDFSNLPLITPIPSRAPVTPPTPLKDTISSPPVILPIEKKKRKKRPRLLRPI